ncbi:aldo/keto reductase [Pseudoroseicyclus aestuarii]|uniref:Diketogulonate reductase-like aldo/keto reductase n=1 Tax=Pseudoroseicyclus aestuarii TaxID=1795041 RepID=A0A318STY8_9RHOB|nr:aldo/keto reductase [Pseudoroseicyclus aestuarii]PYE82320.1 diketogulonate reductase-like aldo/keto reductase [Pseudoroseicyclus aestuarii]
MAERMIGPIPQIGFGTWQREGQEAYACTLAALEAGYRHIDTAEGYGNEEEVGQAIKDSGVPRAEIFVTTKVAPESFGPGQIRPHAEASLRKLGLDKVDLLLLHWPSIHDEYPMEDYVGQFAAVYDAGLTHHIGVSNFTIRHLDRALELLGDRPIATNQCEIHPLMQNRPIVDHCRAKGIPMTAYCPLARGKVLGNPVLKEIGRAHGADEAQVSLAFLMAEGHVVIPSSSKPERIATNLAARDIVLTEGEVARIRGIDAEQRQVDGDWAPDWDK